MEEQGDKIKALLSDPDSLKLIAKLASGFMGNSQDKSFDELSDLNKNKTQSTEKENITDSRPMSSNPPCVLPTQAESVTSSERLSEENIQNQERESSIPSSVMSGFQETAKPDYNNRINLLKSIRPYLNEHKRNRIDGLIKALGTAKIIDTYKSESLDILGLITQHLK